MKGKFGRVLGDFEVYNEIRDSWSNLTTLLIEEGHAVPYFGGSKEETQAAHMLNRERLLDEGIVDKEEYNKLILKAG